jgi:formate-dependent nitrite reductase membrane component NrfD
MRNAPGEPPERRIADRFRAHAPALGTRGGPAPWRRALEGAGVALHRAGFGDARWSYLYREDTRYAAPGRDDGAVAEAAQRMRAGEEIAGPVNGPFLNAPVWTWEVPLYFWLGGIATGSAFAALGADVAGDERSAAIARRVALAAIVPGGPLLIADLGRPERFLNMLRIFKPRSPMSMGAWCLAAFSGFTGSAVAADLTGHRRAARALGAGAALAGTYLGSYTGVLLASTAVPVWSRSRLYLGPLFMCTATATGAAATRLVLAAGGLGSDHPTQVALSRVQTVSMGAELALSQRNERQLGPLADALERGRPRALFRGAKAAALAGVGLSLVGGRRRGAAGHGASALLLLGGLLFRYAWVGAGPVSAGDERAVAEAARAQQRAT